MNRLNSFRFLTYASIVVTIICFFYSVITFNANNILIAIGFLILGIILTVISALLLLDLYSSDRKTVQAEVITIYGKDLRIRLTTGKEMTIRITKRDYKVYQVEDLLTVVLTPRTKQIISLYKI